MTYNNALLQRNMQIESAPQSNRITYNEALLYCQFLEYNGHRDWRMPTKKETYYLNIGGWYHELVNQVNARAFVVPVRDI